MRAIVPSNAKHIADCFVWYGVFKCVIIPIMAFFRGELSQPEAFVGGAVVIAAVLFGEFYFRDEVDADV